MNDVLSHCTGQTSSAEDTLFCTFYTFYSNLCWPFQSRARVYKRRVRDRKRRQRRGRKGESRGGLQGGPAAFSLSCMQHDLSPQTLGAGWQGNNGEGGRPPSLRIARACFCSGEEVISWVRIRWRGPTDRPSENPCTFDIFAVPRGEVRWLHIHYVLYAVRS
jgi:hypothetical protein